MAVNPSSIAATTAASFKNVPAAPSAEDVTRKILIIGSFDPLKTLVTPDVPVQILSPEDAGDQFGFGSMVHRLAISAWRGGQGTSTFVLPQDEADGAAAAAGEVTFTVPVAVTAGTLYLYIAADQYQVNIAEGATVENITDACVTAINADANSAVAATKTAVTFELVLTAKTKGTYGNEISIDFNLNSGEATPVGMTAAVTTAMAGGTGTPDITTGLTGLGTGDNANADYYTGVVHGYLQDTTTLDAIRDYVGAGDTVSGLWAATTHRPFRALTGDTADGSAGLVALIALGDGRKTDRANGIIATPSSPNHPSEIAAQAIGHAERIAAQSAGLAAQSAIMEGVFSGDDFWTDTYDNLNSAKLAGIGATKLRNGVVTINDLLTFYHPDSIPIANNGYRDFEDIAKLQNIGHNLVLNFSGDAWQGVLIVADVTKLNSSTRQNAKDISSVLDDLVALAQAFEAKGWIFSASYTIDQLASNPNSVTIRAGGTGFDNILTVQLSGNTAIVNTLTQFDTNIAA